MQDAVGIGEVVAYRFQNLIGWTLVVPDLDNGHVVAVGYGQISERGLSLIHISPWEGRFSLQWKEQGALPPYWGITGGEKHLYYVDGSALYRNSGAGISQWEKMGDAVGIRYIAAATSSLYAIGPNGQLLKTDLSHEKSKWEKVGQWNNTVVAMAVAGDKLYLADRCV